MEFNPISLNDLLQEIDEIPVDWRDNTALILIKDAHRIVKHLGRIRGNVRESDLRDLFQTEPMFLDICRLFLEMSQDAFVNNVSAQLGRERTGWHSLKKISKTEAETMATAMAGMGLPEMISKHFRKQWTVSDILIERYKMSRGRALAAQKRGRALEE